MATSTKSTKATTTAKATKAATKAPAAKKATGKKAPASKTPSASPQAKEAAAAAPAAKRVPTLAATKGEQQCRVCHEKKPLTSFPTKAKNTAGEVLREDRCRACRAKARAAKK